MQPANQSEKIALAILDELKSIHALLSAVLERQVLERQSAGGQSAIDLCVNEPAAKGQTLNAAVTNPPGAEASQADNGAQTMGRQTDSSTAAAPAPSTPSPAVPAPVAPAPAAPTRPAPAKPVQPNQKPWRK